MNITEKKQIKYGAILSYVLIALNTIYGFVISPYLVSSLGTSEYGVYKTIGSLTASIMILDLGIGGTMQRYIAKFQAEGDTKSSGNFTAMGMLLAGGIGAAVLLVCLILFGSLERIYGGTFSSAEMLLAKELYILSAIQIIVHIFENVIGGAVNGMNRFVFSNSLKCIALVIRALLLFVLLPIFQNAETVLYINIGIEVFLLLTELIFMRYRIGLRIRLYHFDLRLFFDSAKYTIMMFVQSLTTQFNSNVDNVIVGSLIGTAAVTVYSFGLVIFGMFQQLSTAISGVMLPTVTNELKNGADNRRIEDIIISAGKIQFLLLGAAICGFSIIGKEFLTLWLGNGFEDVWIITIILMLPAIWELSQNVCLSVLRARNLLGVRTIALLIGAVFNVLISWFGTKYYGYYAAAVGTGFSTIISSLIIMNIYYHKKLGFSIKRIFSHIVCPAVLPLLLASAVLFGLNVLLPGGTWVLLAAKILGFLAVVVLCLYLSRRFGKKDSVWNISELF